VGRRGAVRAAELQALGIAAGDGPGVRLVAGWCVSEAQWDRWCRQVLEAVDALPPLSPGVPQEVVRQGLGLPDALLLGPLVRAAGLEQAGGRVRLPGSVPDLGPAEAAVAEVERQLREAPFRAPDTEALTALRLGPRELAAAETAGRLVRLRPDVVLLPDGPARAMRVLAGLPQPFSLSAAREALGTSRRVAVPLLEHLDARGWTRRLDAVLREVSTSRRDS
jgi:selenocysteine-specific elongation factor